MEITIECITVTLASFPGLPDSYRLPGTVIARIARHPRPAAECYAPRLTGANPEIRRCVKK
ncbi:MAG: hypothetical protein ACLQLT_02940, partial [Methylovirgula sp.]